MKMEWLETISDMRDEGYVVVSFSPKELGLAKPQEVERRMMDVAADIITFHDVVEKIRIQRLET